MLCTCNLNLNKHTCELQFVKSLFLVFYLLFYLYFSVFLTHSLFYFYSFSTVATCKFPQCRISKVHFISSCMIFQFIKSYFKSRGMCSNPSRPLPLDMRTISTQFLIEISHHLDYTFSIHDCLYAKWMKPEFLRCIIQPQVL